MNGANRQILLRQAAMLEGLRSDLNILLTRPPASLEAYSIKSRATSAIEELKAIQADQDRRIGRLEEGQEALRRLLASITDARLASSVKAAGEGTAPQPTTGSTDGNASAPDVARSGKCAINNTGHYGFANKFNKTPVAVSLDIAGRARTMSVQVGQTQYFYDVPAGPHDYRVQLQAMRPLMSFPPGALLVETTVTFAEGQVYVESCKSLVYEIKNP